MEGAVVWRLDLVDAVPSFDLSLRAPVGGVDFGQWRADCAWDWNGGLDAVVAGAKGEGVFVRVVLRHVCCFWDDFLVWFGFVE